MSGDAEIALVADAGDGGDASAKWSDDAWVGTVGRCDSMLRWLYGIEEFTDDPACVLRVGLGKAHAAVLLSDGTRLEAGETVGRLHFWNEHLPRHAARAPGLGWACEMRRQVERSLQAFARHIETDRAWLGVKAFHAESALSTRRGPVQLARIVSRYGFEAVATERSLLRRLHDFGDDFLLWGLARAFNPAALPRMRFLRDHQELWISRSSLVRLYLPGRQPAEIGAQRSGAA